MHYDEIISWLRETDSGRLDALYAKADETRSRFVGDEVHLRGLIEVSNYCCRSCAYCGLRGGNRDLQRYRLTPEEILEAARAAVSNGYGTVVMQAGEDHGITAGWLADVIHRIKKETGLAVTLSMGERAESDLAEWRHAGADRYLLRFETTDPELYRKIHPAPPGAPSRIALLQKLRQMGYETGSGVMIGIPGQSYETLTRDILAFRELDLDMIGVGPYIPHPATPLGRGLLHSDLREGEQAPATEDMCYRVLALTRIVCPQANIPATTALATINGRSGRELGLQRGANVIMPNVTPLEYRRLYEIYPGKACITESPQHCGTCIRSRIHAIGRTVGTGPGGRVREAVPA
ncbi:MAG TPA: [FeFe] hydrogenase H-cluster radical SAM maturase HydE [Bryobacteraceae bacterium]|nr:[FeFe] hydrogenase H-cluster radical SAM maturase HydE [Bryobacteraceae bacterium]